MRIYQDFTKARASLADLFSYASYVVHPGRWQGIDVTEKPEMAMHELLNVDFQVPLRVEPRDYWQRDIKPNLPFADVHFEERVSTIPSNPGEAWRIWPWGNNAAKFLEVEGKQFSHTYQERFWPKYAGRSAEELAHWAQRDAFPVANHGIRYDYADLNDLMEHLVSDPLSRQAYLPIWFPEDGLCPGRKPCTLGYHFILRHDHLHISYFIRSCDFYRHFQDDCYLTVRLLFWVLEQLSARDPRWESVKPGFFTFHCVSLHCFVNDLRILQGAGKKDSAFV